MTIHFYLRYHTQMGQSISLHRNLQEPGKKTVSDAIVMQYLDDEFWHTSIDIERADGLQFNYTYSVTTITGEQIHEGEHNRTIDLGKLSNETIECIDAWNFEGYYENAFF